MEERRIAERRAAEDIVEKPATTGRKPYPERNVNRRSFYMGDFGPYAGEIKRDDAQIRRDVEDALFYDSWVNSMAVNVDVQGGTVTLTGTVRSRFEKRAAGDDAWEVPGVKDVNNSLKVREETAPTGGEAARTPNMEKEPTEPGAIG